MPFAQDLGYNNRLKSNVLFLDKTPRLEVEP